MNLEEYIKPLSQGNFRVLARLISLIENEVDGYEEVLMKLKPSPVKVIGITGAPGAGKSLLVDALIGEMTNDGKKVGVLCVDPSSPFNKGALLGDRIRMSEWYNHPHVFIRSLSSKGSLGGLHPKIIEITEVMRSADFDYLMIETVGVGQSEVDIAALADITIVILVPEGGDAIQAMKAGLMEVADLFVINKSDREGADSFYYAVKQMLGPLFNTTARPVPVLKTTATSKEGVRELFKKIKEWKAPEDPQQKVGLAAEKVWSLIQHQKMKNIDREEVKNELLKEIVKPGFNIYLFAKKYA